MKKSFSLALLAGMVLVSAFFYQTVLYRRLPVPSDTLVGLYHPWRDLYAKEYPRGVPYKNFLITDPIRQQIPWRKVVMDAWKNGSVPSLNAFTFAGVPIDANVQAAPFYPFNVLFLMLPFSAAWTVLIMLQPFLAGLFLYIYLRHHRASELAAFVGAVSWAFGGFSLSWLTWGTIVHTALWLPLMLMAVDNLILTDRKRAFYAQWTMVLTVAGIMTILAGHIQVALYSGVVVACYMIWRRTDFSGRRHYPWVLLAGLAIVVTTAIQWVPLISFFSESGRIEASASYLKAGWFMPWQHLAQFLAPDFFGNPATLNYWGEWNYGEFVGYIGVIPLVFALSALFLGGVPGFFSGIVVVGLIGLLQSPLSRLPFVLEIPLISVMQPTRLMVLIDFSLSVLAAYGIDMLYKGRKHRLRYAVVGSAVLLAALWVIVFVTKFIGTDAALAANLSIAKRNLVIPTGLFGFFIVWLILFFRTRQSQWKLLGSIALAAVIIFDLFRFGWKFTPFTDAAYFFPKTEIISFLTRQKPPFRVMSLDDRILPPNVSAYYGIESIEGYDPVAPVMYENFLAASERGNADIAKASGFNRIYTAHNIDSVLLPYLNVKYVLALSDISRPFLREVLREGETRLYEYTKGYPRVYLADTVEISKGKDTLTNLFEVDAKYLGVYDGSSPVVNMPLTGNESAEIIAYSTDRIIVRAHAENERLLVIANRYDPRWTALIDGVRVPSLMRVNYLFMGMRVPPGSHDIILSYR